MLRVEDLDAPRVRPHCEAEQLDDLRWLGLDWDEGPDVGGRCGPYRQSERTELYRKALGDLETEGRLYFCDCSRAEIERAASAPHAGEEGVAYPGTCRDSARARVWKRPPSARIRVPEDLEVSFVDRLQGAVSERLVRTTGDFVLRRADGLHAYQLAVVVDDLAMGVTDVVRGADLLSSTARQMWLAGLLGGARPPPRYAHVPLVVDTQGIRLAKRARGVALRHYREAGIAAEVVVGHLADALGLVPHRTAPERARPRELVGGFRLEQLPRQRTVRMQVGLGIL